MAVGSTGTGANRIPSPVGAGSIKAQARAMGSTPITTPRRTPAGSISDPPQAPGGNNFIRELATQANAARKLTGVAKAALKLRRGPIKTKSSIMRRLDGDL